MTNMINAGACIVCFLVGLLLGLIIKVGRAQQDESVEALIDSLTKRKNKP